MTIFVLGASGATGKKLVELLLNMGQNVRVIVRSSSNIPDTWKNNDKISIIKANISDISLEEMSNYIKDCQGIISCLGHNVTSKGIFGKPRKLVRDAVGLICNSIKKNSPDKPVRFVLMNTVGNRNKDLNEHVSISEKIVMTLIRLFIPPLSDNEKASNILKLSIGQKNALIEWVVIRPDTLIDEDKVSEYELFVSPTRSALFNPGKTSRINVGHFMTKLILENELWNQWKGQMPVIYNKVD